MPRSRVREELLLLERRREVARLYLSGITQVEIAARVGIHQSNVSRHLEALRREWLDSAVMAFDARKAQELAKIDQLEAIAHAAWLRSCADAETRRRQTLKTVKGRPAPAPAGTPAAPEPAPDVQVRTWRTRKGQAGDPRFLERIAWCIQKRCEVCGILDAPGTGPATVVTVVGGIDLDVVTGHKPGLPHDRAHPAPPSAN